MKSTLTPLQSLSVLCHASLLTLCSTNYLHAAEPADDSISLTQESEQARKREISAEEDPAVKHEADRLKGLTRWLDEPNKLDLYGSVRIRYRNNNDDSPWSDGGSRAGASLHYQIMPHRWFNFRYEVGFNVLSQVNSILSAGESGGESGDSNVFNRLLYIGIETPSLVATFGKNWSSYYKVASFTDRFEGTGGSASGTYNAGTDGGQTGTGRADKVLQSRFFIDYFPDHWGIKPFNLNLQLQNHEPIPHTDANYGTTAGASAILSTKKNFTVGLAINYADVPDNELQGLATSGIDGNAVAFLAGSRWYGEQWYTGLTVSRLINTEATDENIYFDGSGVELYSQYQLQGPWWLTAGFNVLVPDKGDVQAGDYRVEYAVIGGRYSIDGFSKMFFFNAQIDNGRLADGTELGNVYTIGIHWDLDKKFNWRLD